MNWNIIIIVTLSITGIASCIWLSIKIYRSSRDDLNYPRNIKEGEDICLPKTDTALMERYSKIAGITMATTFYSFAVALVCWALWKECEILVLAIVSGVLAIVFIISLILNLKYRHLNIKESEKNHTGFNG